jgi:glyoxylase-like metal-dependent hydrolase (beta-lactamase superfamily II)
MDMKIFPLILGFDHCYLIQGKGTIMIDGGAPKQANRFLKNLEKLSIKPEEIKLIIITHGHWDHIGSAAQIKEMTGAKIAMHKNEKEWLEKSMVVMPPGVTGWGRSFSKMMTIILSKIQIPAAEVDIILDENDYSLSEFGIPGRIIFTPGHSPGSVSVLLDSGEAFVGDLAMNKFPLRFRPGLPIFAEDLSQVKESWEKLFALGIKTIYPAHGKQFSADIMRKAIEKIK